MMGECVVHFSDEERQALLQLKGVGAKVITRLEQIGHTSLATLQNQDAATVTKQISEMLGSPCWRNSPQAQSAIQAVIDLAQANATKPSI
jgi:hypothetical protein